MRRSAYHVPGESGFVLLGVVMFVLVLTILGLSLFGLSGYEAQFLRASLERSDIFQTANGGLDRARWVLARYGQLQRVMDNIPMGDLQYAVAWQSGRDDSIGPVDFSPNAPPVTIRVIANDQSGRKEGWRCLEAQFQPSRFDVYDRLMSLSGVSVPPGHNGRPGLEVEEASTVQGVTTSRWQQTILVGELRQNYNGPGWQTAIEPLGPGSNLSYSFGGIPDPDVDAYIEARLPSALNAFDQTTGIGNHDFTFDARADHPADSVAFYKTTWEEPQHNVKGDDNWAININGGAEPFIKVRGIAIWLIRDGFLCQKPITVAGTSKDMLVIVASNQRTYVPGEPDAGMSLVAGISSPNVPVILISDARVGVQCTTNGTETTNVPWMSIFAKNAIVTGPSAASGMTLRLEHQPNPDADRTLDKLFEMGALPNTLGGMRGAFAFQPGTWRDLKPSDLN